MDIKVLVSMYQIHYIMSTSERLSLSDYINCIIPIWIISISAKPEMRRHLLLALVRGLVKVPVHSVYQYKT